MGREQIYCLDIFPDSDPDVAKIAIIYNRLQYRLPDKSTPFFAYGQNGDRFPSYLVGGERAALMGIATEIFPGKVIEIDGLHQTGINIAGVLNEDLEYLIHVDPRVVIHGKTINGIGS